MANKEVLQRIKVGDVITANLLNQITDAVNANTRAYAGPKQITEPDDPAQASGTIGNEVFSAAASDITSETVTITDSAGDTYNIERITKIVLTEDTTGRSLTMNLSYV